MDSKCCLKCYKLCGNLDNILSLVRTYRISVDARRRKYRRPVDAEIDGRRRDCRRPSTVTSTAVDGKINARRRDYRRPSTVKVKKKGMFFIVPYAPNSIFWPFCKHFPLILQCKMPVHQYNTIISRTLRQLFIFHVYEGPLRQVFFPPLPALSPWK